MLVLYQIERRSKLSNRSKKMGCQIDDDEDKKPDNLSYQAFIIVFIFVLQ